MSQLRSLVEDSASFDPDDFSPGQLASAITEAIDAGHFLETAVAGWVKNLADRDGLIDLGYPSPTAFLMHQGRMSAGHAKQVVSRANASETAPVAFQAWADGRLSTDQARHLFALAETVPDVFSEAEETLVGIIEPLSVGETAKVLEYWRQSVDGPGDLEPEIQFARRGFSLSKTMGGSPPQPEPPSQRSSRHTCPRRAPRILALLVSDVTTPSRTWLETGWITATLRWSVEKNRISA